MIRFWEPRNFKFKHFVFLSLILLELELVSLQNITTQFKIGFQQSQYLVEEGGFIEVILEAEGNPTDEVYVVVQIIGGEKDFVGVSQPVVFSPNSPAFGSTAVVRFTTIVDTIPETNETFPINILITKGQSILDPLRLMSAVTILAHDDFGGVFGFSNQNLKVAVGEPSVLNLTIFRDRGLFGQVTLILNVTGMSSEALPGVDISPVVRTVFFQENIQQTQVVFLVIDDIISEFNETFLIQLYVTQGFGRVDTTKAIFQVTVLANDAPIRFTRSSYSVQEEIDNWTLNIGLSRGLSADGLQRQGAIEGPANVYFSVVKFPGSSVSIATPDVDFLVFDGVIQFLPGTIYQIIEVQILADTIPEKDELFVIRLTSVIGDVILAEPTSVTVTIVGNDDQNGVLQLADIYINGTIPTMSIDEDDLTSIPIFRIIRNGGLFGTVSVNWKLARVSKGNSIASNDSVLTDMGPDSGTVTLSEGQADAMVVLVIVRDSIPEPVKYFSFSLVDGSTLGGARLGSVKEGLLILKDSDDAYGVVGFGIATDQTLITMNEARILQFSLLRTGGYFGSVTAFINLTYSADQNISNVIMESIPISRTFDTGKSTLSFSIAISSSTFLKAAATFTAALIKLKLADTQIISYNSPRIGPNFQTSVMVQIDDADSFIGFASVIPVIANEPIGNLPNVVPLRVVRDGISRKVGVTWMVVPFIISGATNLTSSDLSPMNGTLVFNKGVSSVDILLQILLDNDPETNESFAVVLLSTNIQDNTQRIRQNAANLTVTIPENNNPGGSFVFADFMLNAYNVSENGLSLNVTVVRQGSALVGRTVEYILTSAQGNVVGAPKAEEQFYGAQQVLYFPPGMMAASGTVLAKADGIPEEDQYFLLQLLPYGPLPLAIIGVKRNISVLIPANDDTNGVINFRNDSLYAIINETTPALYIGTTTLYLVRDRGLFGEVNVTVSVTPQETGDIYPQTSVVTFSAGQKEAFVIVRSLPDDIPEGNETFIYQLINPTGGARIGSINASTIVIKANDFPIYFQPPQPMLVYEGNTVLLTIVRNGNWSELAGISYRTVDGDSKAGLNYVPVQGSVFFLPGERNKTISITILNDGVPQEMTSFYVQLYNPIGDVVAMPNSTLRLDIAPNDGAGGVVVFNDTSPVSMEEGTSIYLSVSRRVASFLPVSVFWQIVTGSTGMPVVQGENFRETFGFINFTVGQTTTSLVLNALNDGIPELAQLFQVQLINITGSAEVLNQTTLGPVSLLSINLTVLESNDPYGVVAFKNNSQEKTIAEDYLFGMLNITSTEFTLIRMQGLFGDVQVIWNAFNVGFSNLPRCIDLLFVGTLGAGVTQTLEGGMSGKQTYVYQFKGISSSFASVSPEDQLLPSEVNGGWGVSGCIQLSEAVSDFIFIKTSLISSGTLLFGFKITATKNKTEFIYVIDATNKTVSFSTNTSFLDYQWRCFVLNVLPTSVNLYLNNEDLGERLVQSESSQLHGTLQIGSSRFIGNIQDLRMYAGIILPNERFEILSNKINDALTQNSGYVTFSSGVSSGTFIVQSRDDLIPEPDQMFMLRLMSPKGGARLSTNSDAIGKLTVTKSDYSNGLFSLQGCWPRTNISESTKFTCYVRRDLGSYGSVTISWIIKWAPNSLWGERLMAPPIQSQFANASGTVVFIPGLRDATFTFSSTDDIDPEPNGNFIVSLVSMTTGDGQNGSTWYSGAVINSNSSQIGIEIPSNDNWEGLLQFMDYLPSSNAIIRPVSVAPEIRVAEESNVIQIIIARAQGTFGNVSAEWRTRDGTARSVGSRPDFKADGNRVYFPNGMRVTQISVTIFDNSDPEDERFFEVELLNPTGGAALGLGAVLRITILASDDAYGVFGFQSIPSKAVVQEANNSVAVFNITRTEGAFRTVNVTWIAEPSSVNKLVPLTGTLVFQIGQRLARLVVHVVDDSIPELDKTYAISLINTTLGRFHSNATTAHVTILSNDDPFGVFVIKASLRPIKVQETAGYITVNISRDAGSVGDVLVFYMTSSTPLVPPLPNSKVTYATPDQDYMSSFGSVVFAGGQQMRQVQIQLLKDFLPEPDEVFYLLLVNVSLVLPVAGGENSTPRLDLLNVSGLSKPIPSYAEVVIMASDDAHGVLEISTDNIRVNESNTGPFLYVVRQGGTYGEVYQRNPTISRPLSAE